MTRSDQAAWLRRGGGTPMIVRRQHKASNPAWNAAIVEADETFVHESRKASREWVRHLKAPKEFPAPDRPRWCEMRNSRSLERRADPLTWQVPVLVLTDRAERRRADRLLDRRSMNIVEALARYVGYDAALCSDRAEAYRVFARLRRQPHYRIDAKRGPRVIDGAFLLGSKRLRSREDVSNRPASC